MRWIRRGIFFLGFIIPLQASADDANVAPVIPTSKQDALNWATQTGNSYLNNIFNSDNRPAWLTRTYLSYAIENKNTPVGEVETTQPIFENRWNTVFWQGRLAYNSGEGTGNLGLGYRYLTDDRRFMWGLNTFFDEAFQYDHQRVGLGGELFTNYLTFRANYYDAISSKKVINTSVAGITYYEQALSGIDASIETPVPHISWMRFVASGYQWIGKNTADVNGASAELRIFPARQVEIDAGLAHDNSSGSRAFLKFDYYLGSPAFIQNSATTKHSYDTLASVDLETQRLQKVIRHNDIVVEKTNNGASGTGITVARGT
jgi:hypothetical protein